MIRDFFNLLLHPEVEFLRNGVIGGVFASISFGVMGSYLVAKRITYLAAAIAHAAIGGIGIGVYLKNIYGVEWMSPLLGAILFSILIVPILGYVGADSKDREDTVISALWTVGMAGGLLLIAQVPGYVDAMSYLFGDILVLSKMDLQLVGGVSIIVVAFGIYFYEPLLAICFDNEFAVLKGVRSKILYFLLLIFTAVSIVLFIRVVGVLLVIGLLSIPPAIGAYMSRQLWHMMVIGGVICFGFIFSGLYISYEKDLPSGLCIAFITGSVYLLIVLVRKVYGWMKRKRFKLGIYSKRKEKECCPHLNRPNNTKSHF